MAFTVAKTYDFAHNKFGLAGLTGNLILEGFADDGGVEYEAVEDEGEVTYGSDGEATFSRSNTRGLIVTITLKETSNSISKLDNLRRAQRSTRKIQPMTWSHVDLLTGDVVGSAYAIFLDPAMPSKGKTAGSRTYRLHLPYASRDTVEGATNSLLI